MSVENIPEPVVIAEDNSLTKDRRRYYSVMWKVQERIVPLKSKVERDLSSCPLKYPATRDLS